MVGLDEKWQFYPVNYNKYTMNFLVIFLSRLSGQARPMLAILLLGALFSCGRDNEAVGPDQGQIIFWTADAKVSNYKVDCYVDGKLISSLQKSSSGTPDCHEAGFPVATVSTGTHSYEVRIDGDTSFSDQLDTEAGKCYNVELY